METLILKKILQQHGFKPDEIEISKGRVRLKIKDVNKQELREEGAPYPAKKEFYYHNYIYPEGFIANLEKIEVTFHPKFYPKNHPLSGQDHPFSGRVNTIKIPSAIYKEAAETANAIHGTAHIIAKSTNTVLLTVDYSKGAGSTPATQLVDQLISELQPRIADSDDISQNINYVSDLGRVLPLVGVELRKEIKDMLLLGKKNGPLLQLRDNIVNVPELVTTQFIDLNIEIFHQYIEKLVREEVYLAQLVRNYLKLDKKNWILADQDLLTHYLKNNNANAAKLKLALETKKDPLFISTTTGNHAFAIKIDFQSKTLFLANPGEDESNCIPIIEQLQKITGCNNLVRVITQQLPREEDIPFNDLCTVDSLALAQMMMDEDKLFEGCLNGASLKTGVFVKKALEGTNAKNSDRVTQNTAESVKINTPKKKVEVPVIPTDLDNRPNIIQELPFSDPPILHLDQEVPVQSSVTNSNLNMQILGGFIAILGVAAVAIAFAALNAATFGIPGLILAGVGIAATLAGVGIATTLAGVGIFAFSSRNKIENTPDIEQRIGLQ